jgi:iron complex outermembrane receptor protein
VLLVVLAAGVSSVAGAAPPQDGDEGEQERPTAPTRYPGLAELFEQTRTAVSPTRREEPVARAPVSISTIEAEELQSLGVRSLSDALRIVPGIEVVRTISTDSNVSARTYNDTSSAAQGMLALVDGRLVYNEFFGNVLWDTFIVNLDEIDRIEVVTGPGSFLYGPNAMHGLVNVFTRSPLDYDEDRVHTSSRIGTYGSVVGSQTYVRRAGDTGLKATMVYDDIEQFDGGSDSNVGDRFFGELRFAHRLDDDEVIEVTGGASRQKVDLLLPELEDLPVSAILSNDVQETFLKANYTNGDLRTQLFWTGFDSTSDADIVYSDFTVGLDTVDLDVQYSESVLDGHTTTFGTGYRYATFDTSNSDVSEGGHDTSLGWAFVQDEFKLGEDIYVTTGVRIDYHSVAGTNVSPRLAAVWEFDEQQYVRASAGAGFRNPSLRELWFGMPLDPAFTGGIPINIVGNDRLDAEQMRSFELGYATEFGGLHEKFRGTATTFYNLIDDLIVFELMAAGLPNTFDLVPDNANDEEAYGIELEGECLFTDTISALANYSWAEQRDRDTDEINEMNPKHMANAGIRMRHPDGYSAMLWLNYTDEAEFEARVADDYLLINGSFSKTFSVGESEGRLFIEAFNLADNDHREHPDGQRYGLILQAGFSLVW